MFQVEVQNQLLVVLVSVISSLNFPRIEALKQRNVSGFK